EKHAKRTEQSCPSLTETDGSLGPQALRSCPLLLEDPGGGTIRDGLKAENKFTATSGLPTCVCVRACVCVCVCVCPVSPPYMHVCLNVYGCSHLGLLYGVLVNCPIQIKLRLGIRMHMCVCVCVCVNEFMCNYICVCVCV